MFSRDVVETGAVEIEMDDFTKPLDQQPLVSNKTNKITTTKFGRMFKFYETNWQCPGITAMCCCLPIAAATAAIGITSFVLASSQASVTAQVLYYVVGAVGCSASVAAMADAVSHCISCTAIGHYVPERAFETNIGMYHKKNLELAETNKDLREEADRLSKVLDRFKSLTTHHEESSEKLNKLLGERTLELNQVSGQLKDSVEKLAQAESAMKVFEAQLENLKGILIKLGNTNKEFKDYLASLNLENDPFKDQHLEWGDDLKDFSEVNNQYERLNNQANQLGAVLTQQLDLMAVYRSSVENTLEKTIRNLHVIDDTDDKLNNVVESYRITLEEKDAELEEIRRVQASLEESFNKMITVLESLKQDPLLKDHIAKIIKMIEEASDSALSDPTHSEQEVSEKDESEKVV